MKEIRIFSLLASANLTILSLVNITDQRLDIGVDDIIDMIINLIWNS